MRNNSAAISHQVNDLLNTVKLLTEDELWDQYDLYFNEDGSVTDDIEEKTFSSLALWAQYTIESETIEEENARHYGGMSYDE